MALIPRSLLCVTLLLSSICFSLAGSDPEGFKSDNELSCTQAIEAAGTQCAKYFPDGPQHKRCTDLKELSGFICGLSLGDLPTAARQWLLMCITSSDTVYDCTWSVIAWLDQIRKDSKSDNKLSCTQVLEAAGTQCARYFPDGPQHKRCTDLQGLSDFICGLSQEDCPTAARQWLLMCTTDSDTVHFCTWAVIAQSTACLSKLTAV